MTETVTVVAKVSGQIHLQRRRSVDALGVGRQGLAWRSSWEVSDDIEKGRWLKC